MKNSDVLRCINFELLKFVRDTKPSKEQLLKWLGERNVGVFYILLKAEVIIINKDIISFSENYLSDNERIFRFSNCVFHIDKEIVDIM